MDLRMARIPIRRAGALSRNIRNVQITRQDVVVDVIGIMGMYSIIRVCWP